MGYRDVLLLSGYYKLGKPSRVSTDGDGGDDDDDDDDDNEDDDDIGLIKPRYHSEVLYSNTSNMCYLQLT